MVFVHGTASSAARWADLVNDLLSDPRIRDTFEFWFFTYDTSNPIVYSAARLRKPSGPRSNASTLMARTLPCAGWC